MGKHKNTIPVPDPDKKGLEYLCPPASWGDMTGLIPADSGFDDAVDNYDDLYPYLPEYKGESDRL